MTLSWHRTLYYRKQLINLLCKSMDWFLYDNGLRRQRVKVFPIATSVSWPSFLTIWFTVQKIYLRMCSTTYANIHHEVTTFQVRETVSIIKIEYLKNKKWHFHEIKKFLNWISKITFFSWVNLWMGATHHHRFIRRFQFQEDHWRKKNIGTMKKNLRMKHQFSF